MTVILHNTHFSQIIFVLPIALKQYYVIASAIMTKRKPRKRTDADRDTTQRLMRWSKEIDRWLVETAPKDGFKTPQDKVRRIVFDAFKAETEQAA